MSRHSHTAAYTALAALARLIPTAPREPMARAATIVEQLASAAPALGLALDVHDAGAWRMHGRTDTTVEHAIATGAGLRLRLRLTQAMRPDALAALAALLAAAFEDLQPPAAPSSPAGTHIAALARVARVQNDTLDFERILLAVLREACAATGAPGGAVAVLGDAEEPRYTVFLGSAAEHLRQARLTPAASAAVARGALTIGAAAPGSSGQAIASVDVPISYGERAVGVLTLQDAHAATLGSETTEFLGLLAEHAAIAIGNAAHVAEQQRQRELLQMRTIVLSEVLEVGHLLRADRDLTEMLTDIAYGIVNAVGFRSVIVNLRSTADPTSFQPVAFAGIIPDDIERLRHEPIPEAIVTQLCDERWRLSSSFLIPGDGVSDAFGAELDRLTTTTVKDERAQDEWQAADMFVTLLHSTAGEVIGFIAVDDPFDRRRPSRRSAEALEIFANQATIAIDNVGLYHASQRRLAEQNALNRLQQAISSALDVRDMLKTVYACLVEALPLDSFYSLIYDQDNRDAGVLVGADQGELYVEEVAGLYHYRGLHAYLMHRREPLLFADLRVERDHLPAEFKVTPFGDQRKRSAAWMGVPLLAPDNELIGALSVHSYTPGRFGADDLAFMQAVAHQLAISFQNARLFAERERRMHDVNVVNQLARALTAPIGLDELADVLFAQLGQALNSDSVMLAVYDRRNDLIEFPLYLERGQRYRVEQRRGGQGVTEYLLRTREPLLLNDDIRQQLVDRGITIIGGIPHSFLGVPLLVGAEAVGVLAVQDYAQNHAFGPRQLELLQAIALQIASAIEKARLLHEREREINQMRTLNSVGKVASSTLNLTELFAAVYDEMSRYRSIDTLLLSICDPDTLTLEQIITIDGGELWHAEPAEALSPASYTGQVVRSGKPLLVRDARTAEVQLGIPVGPLRDRHKALSLVCVPLYNTAGKPFGMLSMQSYTPEEYDLRDIDFLTNVAQQIALSIQNAALFRSEQDKRRVADTLREVTQSLSSTLDLREVLEIILMQLQRVVPYDSTSVQLLRDDNHLQIISGRLLNAAQEFSKLAFPADSPRHPNHIVLETRRPFIVSDTALEYPAFQEMPEAQHIRAWMGVPLIYGNQLLGMITLDSCEPAFYNDEMADLALLFATQAAQAMAHARLFDQIRQFNQELEQMVAERTAALTAEKERLEAVHTITTALTATLDIDEIVLKTLKLAAAAIGVSRGSLLIRDPLQDQLIYRAVLSEQAGLLALNEPFALPDGNLVEWTLTQQQGVVIADVTVDPRWVTLDGRTNDIRSFVAVPLLTADIPIGVLMLNSREPGYFNDEHLRLLSTIASEVAIAVHNAELYNFINEQATRLSDLLQAQREETGKNRAILESVSEGVLVLDEQDTVLLFNRAASQVLQIPDDLVVDHALSRIGEYGHLDEQGRVQPIYAALAEGVWQARQKSDPINRLLELPGQTIDLTFTPVTTPEGGRIGVAAVLRDITREIEADKTKREFISTVSHELRTPLTSVKGYVDLMLLGTTGAITDMQRNFLQIVKGNADRLNGLVEDILEISRIENGKVNLILKPLDLAALVNDIALSLRTETQRKRLSVRIEVEPTLPAVEGDDKRIMQVLTNLLSNAHKYTRDGGQIHVTAYRRNDMVQVDVADTGVGIPHDELPKMFSRFFRANNALKDEVGGTGLGLSIAKSFVELHGGDMWVASELEVGTTFSFTLPIEQRRAPRNPTVLVSNDEVIDVN